MVDAAVRFTVLGFILMVEIEVIIWNVFRFRRTLYVFDNTEHSNCTWYSTYYVSVMNTRAYGISNMYLLVIFSYSSLVSQSVEVSIKPYNIISFWLYVRKIVPKINLIGIIPLFIIQYQYYYVLDWIGPYFLIRDF